MAGRDGTSYRSPKAAEARQVDATVIGQRKEALPGEVSSITCWSRREVSRVVVGEGATDVAVSKVIKLMRIKVCPVCPHG